jgi:hypothetical protein
VTGILTQALRRIFGIRSRGRPRVLMVKEHVDVFGPGRPARFSDFTPRALLDLFPFKPTYWEMTTLLRADWIIVLSETKSGQRSYAESISRLAPIIDMQSQGAVPLSDLDLSQYDIVISFEPCLSTLRYFRARNWFYFHHEHTNDWYNQSKRKPASGYTAFLDHMCGATDVAGESYPQAIAFPYLRDPQTMRACFRGRPVSDCPTVWVDARTIMLEANGIAVGRWTDACDKLLRKLQSASGVRIITRGEVYREFYNLSPASDAAAYLDEMSTAQFYFSRAAAGAGQALCDAASLGLVCFGLPELVYHRMVCPPEQLGGSLSDALENAAELFASPIQMKEAVRLQDKALRHNFQSAPMRRLLDRAGLRVENLPAPRNG